MKKNIGFYLGFGVYFTSPLIYAIIRNKKYNDENFKTILYGKK